MNAIVQAKSMSPVEKFVGEVLDAERMADLRLSLPSHIKPELFQRNLLNAVMINPELMDYPPGLLFREVSKAASLGLFLDPQLGEAYVMIAYNYKTTKKEPQLRVGYRGMIKLARQSGDVLITYAHEVRANDKLVCRQGTSKELIHEPELFTDRGDVIGYYAVIKYTNGEFDFEPMSVPQIHAIRDRSDGWKAFTDKKIKSTPWATDEDEMAKKTTFRRLLKRAPQSPQLAEAIRIEDAAEHSEMVRTPALRTAASRPPSPPATAQIAHQAKTPIVVETARETVAAEAAAAGTSRPPSPPAAKTAPKAEPLTEDGFVDYAAVIADFETQLAAAASKEIVEEVRESFADHLNAMSRQENRHCQNLYEDALARVAK